MKKNLKIFKKRQTVRLLFYKYILKMIMFVLYWIFLQFDKLMLFRLMVSFDFLHTIALKGLIFIFQFSFLQFCSKSNFGCPYFKCLETEAVSTNLFINSILCKFTYKYWFSRKNVDTFSVLHKFL